MRDFKFRAWDGKDMHYNVMPWHWDFVISLTWHKCEKSTGTGVLGSGGSTGEFLVPGIRFENLMQFTGLKDKNGKEIYEGDILSASRTITGMLLPDGKTAEVFGNISQVTRSWDEILVVEIKVNENSISFILPEEGGTYQERGKKLQWAILGNIHENPNLIPQTT